MNLSLNRPEKTAFEEYRDALHYEDGLLMADGYPAEWDLFFDFVSPEIKELIKKVSDKNEKNTEL